MPVTNPKVDLLSFQDLVEFATNNLDEYETQYQLLNDISADLRNNPYIQGGLTTEEAWANEIYKKLRDAGYEVEFNGNGKWTCSAFSTQPTITTQNPINSNIGTVSTGNLRTYYGGINEYGTTGAKTWQPLRFPASGGLGTRAMYLVGSVASGVGAVATGISLGKTISPLLYDIAPNYWESIGVTEGAFEPEAWNSITNGSDSPFAGLFNFILGLDPDTGNSQMYMDENAFAYMAYALSQNGWFGGGGYNYATLTDEEAATIFGDTTWTCNYMELTATPMTLGSYTRYVIAGPSSSGGYIGFSSDPGRVTVTYWTSNTTTETEILISTATNNAAKGYSSNGSQSANYSSGHPGYNNKSATVTRVNYSSWARYTQLVPPMSTSAGNKDDEVGWTSIYGTEHTISGAPEGVTDQTGATLPDVSTWNDIPSTLQSLKQQYPNLFQDPMVWNTDDPASPNTGDVTRYIPVPFPALDTNGNPYSSTQTQTATQLDQSTTPTDVLDLLMKTIQQTETQTQPQDVTPPINPTDVGTGTSPIPIPPSGSASALWSVYHPTQAQVNAFGGWLWSNDFLDQLLRVFQNPMDAVISLRKVFITPIDAGQSTIHAGALDSEVPSATVTQQYVYADCGYINCYEHFGNVFDYTNTEISIYLPFIGIEQLNTAEIMRSTLHVKYGMDLFTGVCLATIEVTRDGNTVVMYQYSGNASVEYPLSGQRAAGFLSGLMSIGGATALAATGGGSVVAAGMALHGMQQMSTVNVSHSGGFAGNAGAMGCKIPYLIIERPQTKIAELFPSLAGYPTNKSGKLNDFEGQVVVSDVHVEGMSATDTELSMIEDLLKEGVLL